MASKKLKKYLAYYQKVLKDDPENIEARLRLAAIFKELGRNRHAVEEYVTASKLLAKEGLPLEAIAACKAVLELDPTHTEVQFFLARLFAQVPGAGGVTTRVATPVTTTGSSPRIETGQEAAIEPITLAQPKSEPTVPGNVVEAAWEPHERETVKSDTYDIETSLADEVTDSLDERDPDHNLTSEYTPQTRDPELVATVDLDPADILSTELLRDRERQRDNTSVQPRTNTEVQTYMAANEPTETIELGVFDMNSLGLDDSSAEFDLDDFDDLDIDEFDDNESSDLTERAALTVRRGDLPEIPLFSELSVGTFMEVLQAMNLVKVSMGGPIIEPFMPQKSLYVVVRGEATVWRSVDGIRIELDTLEEGDFFGEFRLLTGRDSGATVSAKTDIELLEISEEVINMISEHDPEIWDVLWEFYYQRMKNNLLAGSDLFMPLSAPERDSLAKKFKMMEVVEGDAFLKEGQPCEHVYLILNGEVVVERDHGGGVQELARLREGEFFGVVSSFREDPYTADVRAVRDTNLLCLPSADFRHVVDSNDAVARKVQQLIRKRRSLDSAFMSGITPYGDYGVTKG